MRIISTTIFYLSIITALYSQEERLRLIHADVLRREVVGQQVLQIVEGNVQFQQGSTVIKCDRATQFLGLDKAALIGNVEIFDEGRTLFADTVYFYQKANKELAVGHVKVIAEADTITAERMTYYELVDKLVAEGNVKIVSPEDNMVVTGGYADYDKPRKHRKIYQNPVLIQFDSLGTETMRVVGDTMDIFDDGDRARVSRNVEITQPGMKATCGLAEYFKASEKYVLLDNPQVWQSNLQISGDTLLLYLKDSQLSRAQVIGNALAVSDADTLNKGRWINKLSGQTMDFYLQDRELEKVVVFNQATSFYHVIENDQYKGANEISGDKIILYFSQDQVSRVRVESEPDVASGKYTPPRI
jgi:lipopolysaccharide export system protein LptA